MVVHFSYSCLDRSDTWKKQMAVGWNQTWHHMVQYMSNLFLFLAIFLSYLFVKSTFCFNPMHPLFPTYLLIFLFWSLLYIFKKVDPRCRIHLISFPKATFSFDCSFSMLHFVFQFLEFWDNLFSNFLKQELRKPKKLITIFWHLHRQDILEDRF